MYVLGPIKEGAGELPAFIPPAREFVPEVSIEPPVNQEPEVPEVTEEGGVDVEVLFPEGD